MTKPVLSVRISHEVMRRLEDLAVKMKSDKSTLVESALEMLYSTDENGLPVGFSLEASVSRHIQPMEKEPAFHLGAEVVKSGHRYIKKGELADDRFGERINIRPIMRAYRNKAHKKPYDKSQEPYFELLTSEFRGMVHGIKA